jgi:hypothetical protein
MRTRQPRYTKEEHARLGNDLYEREVEAVNAEPLIGMEVLNGYSLRIDVTKGGGVTIEKP